MILKESDSQYNCVMLFFVKILTKTAKILARSSKILTEKPKTLAKRPKILAIRPKRNVKGLKRIINEPKHLR